MIFNGMHVPLEDPNLEGSNFTGGAVVLACRHVKVELLQNLGTNAS